MVLVVVNLDVDLHDASGISVVTRMVQCYLLWLQVRFSIVRAELKCSNGFNCGDSKDGGGEVFHSSDGYYGESECNQWGDELWGWNGQWWQYH